MPKGILSDTVTYKFFYAQYEFPTREEVYTYDHLNLISDFGGYLGLLLGYSILRFYDIVISVAGNAMKKLNPKGQLARSKHGSKPADDEMPKWSA